MSALIDGCRWLVIDDAPAAQQEGMPSQRIEARRIFSAKPNDLGHGRLVKAADRMNIDGMAEMLRHVGYGERNCFIAGISKSERAANTDRLGTGFFHASRESPLSFISFDEPLADESAAHLDLTATVLGDAMTAMIRFHTANCKQS